MDKTTALMDYVIPFVYELIINPYARVNRLRLLRFCPRAAIGTRYVKTHPAQFSLSKLRY